MIYYPNTKILYFASRSTGSRSINTFFKKIDGNDAVAYNNTLDIPTEATNTENKLVVSVSNPYIRIYDKWKQRNEWLTKVNRANEIVTFAESVKIDKTGPLNVISEDLNTKNLTPDIIIRLEYIKSDIKLIPGVDLEKNKTHRWSYATHIATDGVVRRYSEWKSNYTQELADIIYTKFEKDFTAYNYSKDSWK